MLGSGEDARVATVVLLDVEGRGRKDGGKRTEDCCAAP